MADKSKQDDWVQRVLGVPVPASGTVDMAALKTAASALNDAFVAVGQQIGELQSLLRASDDGDLRRIAEFGLNAMTANHRIKLQAALIDVTAGAPAPGVLQKAAGLAGNFLRHLESDFRVSATDANPFGIKVAMRSTLGPPLRALQAALKQAS